MVIEREENTKDFDTIGVKLVDVTRNYASEYLLKPSLIAD
jgi:hypothetical protein